MFNFEKFGLGGFNECSLMGDDVFQGINELSDFPSGHTARLTQECGPLPLRA
jgi:hypothetical protein